MWAWLKGLVAWVLEIAEKPEYSPEPAGVPESSAGESDDNREDVGETAALFDYESDVDDDVEPEWRWEDDEEDDGDWDCDDEYDDYDNEWENL